MCSGLGGGARIAALQQVHNPDGGCDLDEAFEAANRALDIYHALDPDVQRVAGELEAARRELRE